MGWPAFSVIWLRVASVRPPTAVNAWRTGLPPSDCRPPTPFVDPFVPVAFDHTAYSYWATPDSGSSADQVTGVCVGMDVQAVVTPFASTCSPKPGNETSGIDGGVLSTRADAPPENDATALDAGAKLTEEVVRPSPRYPAPPRTPTENTRFWTVAALALGVNR